MALVTLAAVSGVADFTEKHVCVDAANEHVSAVVHGDGGPRELLAVVVVHVLNSDHHGAAVRHRQPEHLYRAATWAFVTRSEIS